MVFQKRNSKINLKNKQVAVGLLILAIVAAVALFLNFNSQNWAADGYHFTVSQNGEVAAVYSLGEIKEMPAKTVFATLHSAQQGEEKGLFTGVALADILALTGKTSWGNYAQFVTKAGDGYSTVLGARDLQIKDNVLVIYGKDGQDLAHFKDDGEGPMRLLIMADTYGNRCTQFLVGVDCR